MPLCEEQVAVLARARAGRTTCNASRLLAVDKRSLVYGGINNQLIQVANLLRLASEHGRTAVISGKYAMLMRMFDVHTLRKHFCIQTDVLRSKSGVDVMFTTPKELHWQTPEWLGFEARDHAPVTDSPARSTTTHNFEFLQTVLFLLFTNARKPVRVAVDRFIRDVVMDGVDDMTTKMGFGAVHMRSLEGECEHRVGNQTFFSSPEFCSQNSGRAVLVCATWHPLVRYFKARTQMYSSFMLTNHKGISCSQATAHEVCAVQDSLLKRYFEDVHVPSNVHIPMFMASDGSMGDRTTRLKVYSSPLLAHTPPQYTGVHAISCILCTSHRVQHRS